MSTSPDAATITINTGYASFQIARALQAQSTHADPAVRANALKMIERWTSVLQGMATGNLSVGSRQPIRNVPVWATPEVVTGGFVTGNLLAGGELRDHERTLLNELNLPNGGRRELNAYYLSDDGLARLNAMLQQGTFELQVAEEGTFLVVAWLLQQQHIDQAHALLEEITPFFDRLRFYPIPTSKARDQSSLVCLQTVGEARTQLANIEPSDAIRKQREAITVWRPLYAEMVQLFLETVEGEVPQLASTAPPIEGKRREVIGGQPLRHMTPAWHERARALLAKYNELTKQHTLCNVKAKHHFYKLGKALTHIVRGWPPITEGQTDFVRLILACYVTKRGVPSSERWLAFRAQQERQINIADFADFAKVLIQRLAALPKDVGLEQPERYLQAIAAEEASATVPATATLPDKLHNIVARCLLDTIPVLVERGLITSGDVLARVLPAMTSQLRASGIADPLLRRVYAAVYRAFRQRRSLLLLNLESQVRLEELPWLHAIEQFRCKELAGRELATEALREILMLTLTEFPQAIIPNKLLQEIRALLKSAELKLPLVDELAADIFMGTFAPQFLAAAKMTGTFLGDSLYTRYFGIDPKAILAMDEARFASHCYQRAGTRQGNHVAYNGTVIEQQQILTTQNLAVLVAGLDLRDRLAERWSGMAQTCFEWVCTRHQLKYNEFHAKLIMVKNTAYAWRQMIFYLSMLTTDQQAEWFTWANGYLAEQSPTFRTRFQPAFDELRHAFDATHPRGQRFTGWSTSQHWLLPDDRRRDA